MTPSVIRVFMLLLLTKVSVIISAQQIYLTEEQKINVKDAADKIHLQQLHPFTDNHPKNTVVFRDSFVNYSNTERNLINSCVDSSFVKIFETTTDRDYSFFCFAKIGGGAILLGGDGREK